MRVVATYVIMHVIVYFGVCKCHGCSSRLCKWMFNLVMQCRLFKYICWCFVDRVLCEQRKSHRTRTKQWNPSVMFSSITHNCIPAIICSQHTRLVSSNRLCCYRSSHVSDYRHVCLVSHTSCSFEPFLFSCLNANNSSKWTACRISHTPLIWLTVSFVLPNHKQFIRVNRMP